MTRNQAITVLEGLEMKHRRLSEQEMSELSDVHGEIAKALALAFAALESGRG